jgi:glycosyltransferase involved in cell wall biosynthesis
MMDKLLNICIISQEYPPYTNWGGIAIYYQELTKELIKSGHNVTVLSRFTKESPRLEKNTEHLRVLRIGLPNWIKYLVGRAIDKLLFAHLARRVISNIEKTNLFDIIETTETYLEGKALVSKQKYRDRTIVQCHGSNVINVIPRGLLSYIHKLDFKLCYRVELQILKNSKMIIVPSNSGKNILLESGLPTSKIELIYHGINTDIFKPAKNKTQNQTLEVLFAGKLHNMKGVDFIWKVMEKIGTNSLIRFNLVGAIHPSEKNEVLSYLNRFSEFSTYYDPVDHDEMPRVYQKQHVLLQPSRFEQFGLVYAEAMASGLLVFAGNTGGGSEIVSHNDTGFIIDPDNDVDFVVNKLKEIAENQASFDEMRDKARKHIINNFSQKTSYKKKLDYYYKVSN